MMEWWSGLDDSAHDWIIISGLVMLAVVGITVGVVGAANFATLEPLMHLGLSVGIAGLLGAVFVSMARLT